METLLAVAAGALFAAGVYMALDRDLLRVIFGVMLLGTAANLAIVAAGRVGATAPPIVPADGSAVAASAVANPVPQALVLTAIVIGFGLVGFALVLVLRGWRELGTTEADEVLGEEDVQSPEEGFVEAEIEVAEPVSARAARREEAA